MNKATDDEARKLCELARAAAELAYAKYSNFRVGAALVTSTGEIFSGANVENASYGLSICAERATIAKAVAAGSTDIVCIAVACIDARPEAGLHELMPCGACRQWFIEFAPDMNVLIWSTSEEIHAFGAADLLAVPFTLRR